MNILFIGDVVGHVGKEMVSKYLKQLKKDNHFDLVIANGENIAERNGITPELFRSLVFDGIDVVTMGNHTWDRKEILDIIDDEPNLIRPANYPQGTPGNGYVVYDMGRYQIGVVNVMGNVYISTLPSPFMVIDQIIQELKAEGCKHIIIDFHGEATSEKIAFGHYVDGKVSAVVGTHTHVQTADEKILPKATAYISDVGMTGPYESVLGVEIDQSVRRFASQMPTKFEQALGKGQFNAVIIKLDDHSGQALAIERVQYVEK